MTENIDRFVAPTPRGPKVLHQPQHREIKHGKPFLPWKRKPDMTELYSPEFLELFEAVKKQNPYSTDAARLLSVLAAVGGRAFFYSGHSSKNVLERREHWNNGSSIVGLYLYEMNLEKIAAKVRGINSVYFRNVGIKTILESDVSDPAVVELLVERWVVGDSA